MLSKTHVFKGSQRKFDQDQGVEFPHLLLLCFFAMHTRFPFDVVVFSTTWWRFAVFVDKEHLCVELFCVAQTNFCKPALVSTTQFRLLKTSAVAKATLLPRFVACIFNDFAFSHASILSFLLHCHCNFAQLGQFAVKQAKKSTFLDQKIQNAY